MGRSIRPPATMAQAFKIDPPVVLKTGDSITITIDDSPTFEARSVTFNSITSDNTGQFYPSTNTPFYTSPAVPPSSSQICSICGAKVEMAYTTQHNAYHQSILDSQRYTAEQLNKLQSILSKIADIDGLTLGDLVGCEEQGQV